ncbi:MAG: FtsX-like permease family protein [Nitrospirales bacterium]|nr:FtsX-like permease family protein [Nitrospirales bacterium]
MRNLYVVLAVQHVWSRPVRTLLTLLGVSVGVAAAMAIRIANVEVFHAFEASVTTVVGEATIEITDGEHGIDERIITKIRQHPSIRTVEPVIQKPAVIVEGPHQGKSIALWGLDLVEAFATQHHLRIARDAHSDLSLDDLLAPDSVFIDARFAQRWDVHTGDALTLSVDGMVVRVMVRGVFEPVRTPKAWGHSLVVMDIAAAQMLLGLVGHLDAMHVLTIPDMDVDAVIEDLRHEASWQVDRMAQRNQQVERMIQTFQLNLTTMSVVGLLVGIFLVYNTIAFSVVQHRREIGILRALGLSRAQVSGLFMGEAAGMGLVGGIMGTGLGAILAELLTRLVQESVTELYTSVTGSPVDVPFVLYAVGGGLGIVISTIGAVGPSWEAGWTSPVRALAPGDYEQDRQLRHGRYTGLSLGMFAGAVFLTLPGPVGGMPIFGYASALFVLLGCALLAPISIKALERFSQWRGCSRVGLVSRLAVDQIVRAPGRNGVTLSALMIGIAIMVGVGTMVQSFRQTVEVWIDQTLMSDLIVVPHTWPQNNDAKSSLTQLSPAILEDVRRTSGVEAVDPYYQERVQSEGQEFVLVTRDFSIHGERSRYLFVQGASGAILNQAHSEDGVIVSEVLSKTLDVTTGDFLRLTTPTGTHAFSIMGIFYDYATDGGKVVMDRSLYQKFWGEPPVGVLALYLAEDIDRQKMKTHLENVLAVRDPVTIIQNGELRQEILDIFDRTFRVTRVLEFIAIVVAMLGIANTLVTSVLERQRELSTLRAIGAGRNQIQRMVFTESLYLSILGSLLGLLGGMLLAIVLIEVINAQSFGWTIRFVMPWTTLVEAVGVSCGAALLAGAVPARWAMQRPVSEGLRYE